MSDIITKIERIDLPDKELKKAVDSMKEEDYDDEEDEIDELNERAPMTIRGLNDAKNRIASRATFRCSNRARW